MISCQKKKNVCQHEGCEGRVHVLSRIPDPPGSSALQTMSKLMNAIKHGKTCTCGNGLAALTGTVSTAPAYVVHRRFFDAVYYASVNSSVTHCSKSITLLVS